MDKIYIKDFDYDLPDERIAKFPLDKRENSKLLIYNNGKISDTKFTDITNYIDGNSLVVFNNTKVIHARIIFRKPTGARIEVFCLEPILPSNYEQNFAETSECIWKCAVGNLKKWKNSILSKSFIFDGNTEFLNVEIIENKGETLILKFSWSKKLSFAQVIDLCGEIPIPPYLNRNSQDIDNERYQTVYSKFEGSVAAPTAGLHFSKNILKKLIENGVCIDEVTLHIGAGTFKPVKSDLANEHIMHSEHFAVKKQTIENIIAHIENITAVGTTSVRTIESLYWLGCKLNENAYCNNLIINQFENYEIKTTEPKTSLNAILKYMETRGIDEIQASTQIMITPEYKPKLVKRLITNFHQPQSTLLLLVAAFIGDDWRKVYDYALKNNFRFLSYGDSSLLIP